MKKFLLFTVIAVLGLSFPFESLTESPQAAQEQAENSGLSAEKNSSSPIEISAAKTPPANETKTNAAKANKNEASVVTGQQAIKPSTTKPSSDDVDYSQYAQSPEYYSVQEVYDPFEKVNRKIDGFNRFVDRIILKPVATYYRDFIPAKARQGVSNFIDNAQMPVTFVNSVLQGDVNNSFASLFSFVVNTSLGVGGIIDVTEEAGLKLKPEDTGQTLGKYRVPGGPYIILPLLGPSNARDLVGRVGDSFLEPINYVDEGAFVASYLVVKIVNGRAKLLNVTEDIDSISFDPYATIRSVYTQRRNTEISR